MIEDRRTFADRLRSAATLFHHDAAGGVILILAAILALLLDNSRLAWISEALLQTRLSVSLGDFGLDKPLLLWINDGLMAIFFLLVGLEIKRELLVGELATRERAVLPVLAAIGGMILPAIIYVLINIGDTDALRGWAIPTATDIAFAVGVLAVLGSRVPTSLKAFLLALAIIDDLAAIIIIAMFYTSDLSLLSLGLAAIGICVLAALNASGVTRVAPYALAGIFIWVCVLKSGVHATLAGVVVALAIPLHGTDETGASPLERLEHDLAPWVLFAVMPLFAFANAGVSLSGMSLGSLFEPIPLGVALGLLVGKTAGIFGAVWAADRWQIAPRPEGATWDQVLGVAMLGGIGFTMSLFIGMLAFPDPDYAAPLRLGVLIGSLLAAIGGYLLLRFGLPGNRDNAVSEAGGQTSA
ncbi:MAG: Na+/H+ antiporter NhaA [Sphingomonadales bacterium]|nr:Na+/H+ antiporter NhaA [Sphingomonadales bacterium]